MNPRLSRFINYKLPVMGGYAEDEEEPERRGLMFFGTDVSKIPCFKHSFMYAIGSGMLTGVAYNLAFSRTPYKLAFGVYTSVLFGYWFVCRYDYRSVLSLESRARPET